MIEIDQQGSNKVRISDVPAAAPGKCVVCGYTGGDLGGTRKFIDVGLDIDFYGVVYFCTDCMDATAEILGYITPEKAAALSEDNARLSLRVGELEVMEAKLNDIRTSIWPDTRALPEPVIISNPDPVAPESDDAEGDPGEGQDDREAEPIITVEGPDDSGAVKRDDVLAEFGL